MMRMATRRRRTNGGGGVKISPQEQPQQLPLDGQRNTDHKRYETIVTTTPPETHGGGDLHTYAATGRMNGWLWSGWITVSQAVASDSWSCSDRSRYTSERILALVVVIYCISIEEAECFVLVNYTTTEITWSCCCLCQLQTNIVSHILIAECH